MKMKSSVLLIVAMIASSAAMAQVKVAIGIKGGPNFSTINMSDAGGTYKSRTGWHGGGYMLFKFAKVGIQPEVLFSQQGANIKASSSDVKFNYVNIPVMVKLYTVLGINLQIGPQFGFLSNNPAIEDPNSQSGQQIKGAFKSSDISASMGVGWDLPFGLSIDGRYNLGVSKINTASAPTTRNQVWQFSVGYRLFQLGK